MARRHTRDRLPVCPDHRTGATLPRGRSPPERAQDPALGGSPDHEQECLLRQAAIALLAVPVSRAARVSAVMRRSTLARVSIAVGLSFVLGVGVLGAGQPATAIATRPNPIGPLSQSAFATTFSTDRDLSEAVTIAFATPMDRASVAAALKVQPAKPVDLSWDSTGTILTVSPRGHWAVATLNTVTVQAGALTSSGEPLARPARTVFMTRATGQHHDHPDRSARTARRARHDLPRRPSAGRSTSRRIQGAIRLDPPTPGTVRTITRFEGLTRFEFVPSGLAPPRRQLPARRLRRPRHRRSPARAGRRGGPHDHGTVRRPLPACREQHEDRPGRRALGPLHAVDGSCQHGPRVLDLGRREVGRRFRPLGRDRTPSSCSTRRRRSRTAPRCRWTSRPAPGTPRDCRSPRPRTPIFHTARRGVIPVVDLGGGDPITGGGAVGGGSWAAVETYYLGLMNCTRTGGWVTSTGNVQQPRRTQRRPAQARCRDQLEGQPAVRQADGDRRRRAATSSAATPAIASAAPATRAIAGRRTSAAARVVPGAPSWPPTSSSRARSRTTAAIT